jgi:hypothetical protein
MGVASFPDGGRAEECFSACGKGTGAFELKRLMVALVTDYIQQTRAT